MKLKYTKVPAKVYMGSQNLTLGASTLFQLLSYCSLALVIGFIRDRFLPLPRGSQTQYFISSLSHRVSSSRRPPREVWGDLMPRCKLFSQSRLGHGELVQYLWATAPGRRASIFTLIRENTYEGDNRVCKACQTRLRSPFLAWS